VANNSINARGNTRTELLAAMKDIHYGSVRAYLDRKNSQGDWKWDSTPFSAEAFFTVSLCIHHLHQPLSSTQAESRSPSIWVSLKDPRPSITHLGSSHEYHEQWRHNLPHTSPTEQRAACNRVQPTCQTSTDMVPGHKDHSFSFT
jgi:hypothetical protein